MRTMMALVFCLAACGGDDDALVPYPTRPPADDGVARPPGDRLVDEPGQPDAAMPEEPDASSGPDAQEPFPEVLVCLRDGASTDELGACCVSICAQSYNGGAARDCVCYCKTLVDYPDLGGCQ